MACSAAATYLFDFYDSGFAIRYAAYRSNSVILGCCNGDASWVIQCDSPTLTFSGSKRQMIVN